ncbi:MAG: HD-like signal output (HDOD) protein/signal transduction histidine kinase [Oleispira sp.]|jgi:HD-like signal output (HDOD) protein/signal transduction histidine kinase
MTNKADIIFEELKVNELPSLPHVLVEMLDACQSSSSNFQHISDIISHDAAVTARVVSLGNSSFYSGDSKINSLERALLVLGTETITTIVITSAVQQFFSGFNNTHTQYLKLFWKRSLTCALLAKSLATLTSYPQTQQAYLTGLLHNIGELVLETNHPEDYSEVAKTSSNETDRQELENKRFLTNHSDVGAWLIDEWNLGEFTSDAVRFHHAPLNTVLDAHHLVKLVFLSSQLSKDNALEDPASFEIAESMFNLSAALTREIVIQIQKEVVNVARSLNIDIDSLEAESDDETDIDQQKQNELAEQIKNIGLLQTTNNYLSQSSSLPQLFQGIQEAIELLFGYRNTKVLLIDDLDGHLKYRQPNTTGDALTALELSIPLQSERSIIANAVVNRTIVSSAHQTVFAGTLPVIDQHFMRLSNSENIICLPMIFETKIVGALVMGALTKTDLTASTLQLLDYFSLEAARACSTLMAANKTPATSASEQELQLKIREVAHEANNPLSIVRNYLETLAAKLGEEHEAQSEIDILREEIDRTGQIILRLRDLEENPEDEEPGVDINKEITDLTKLFQGSLFLSHAVNCKLDLDNQLVRQQGNRNPLRQVLINLIKNAAESMDDGGEIRVSSAHHVNVNGRDFVEIVISDKGPGFTQAVLSTLFQPTTSTKGSGHSGLGLSISKNLINEMGGTISCRSSNKGASMQILIPIRTMI